MKKAIAVAAALACGISIFSFNGCSGGSAASQQIKIGQLAALSGSSAAWGTAEKNGAQMAVDEINKAGGVNGKTLKLITYDNKGTAPESITSMKKLIDQDGVSAIVGGNISDGLIACAPIYTQAKIPVIATMPSNSLVTVDNNNKVRDYCFRLVCADKQQGTILAQYVYSKLGLKTTGILYEAGLDYSEGISQTFTAEYEKLGGKIVASVAFQNGDVDFRSQLTKIKAANPEALLVPTRYKEAALAVQQAKQLGLSAALIGSDGWNSSVFLQMTGTSAEGASVFAHASLDDPSLSSFCSNYKSTFKADPEVNAIYAYDSVKVFAKAMEAAKSNDPSAIRGQLASVQYDGLTGHIQFSTTDHNVTGKQILIISPKSGKFVIKDKFTPTA